SEAPATTASARAPRRPCRRSAREAERLWQSAAVAHLRTVLAGAAASRLAWGALTRRPPGGRRRWERTNHRGEPLTLLEGPALAADPAGALVAAVAGPALALLPEDLGERAMLGDGGANAAGALLGVALVAGARPRVRLAVLAAVAGLTLASEKVSFTKVIEAT